MMKVYLQWDHRPFLLPSIPKLTRVSTFSPNFTISCFRIPAQSTASAAASATVTALEQPGGKMVVELVAAFNELTGRMSLQSVLSTSSSRLLFKSLKLSIPILQSLPLAPDGRSPLSKALSIALLLADLQVSHVSLTFISTHFPLQRLSCFYFCHFPTCSPAIFRSQ